MSVQTSNITLEPNISIGDILNSCRICLCNSSLMYEIFDVFEEEQSNIAYRRISDKISYCTGVMLHPNDGRPSRICQLCLYALTSAYDFKSRCIKSEQTFQRLLNIEQNNIDTLQPFDRLFLPSTNLVKSEIVTTDIYGEESLLNLDTYCKDEYPILNNFNENDSDTSFDLPISTFKSNKKSKRKKDRIEIEYPMVDAKNLKSDVGIDMNNLTVDVVTAVDMKTVSKMSNAEIKKSRRTQHKPVVMSKLECGAPHIMCEKCGITFKSPSEAKKHNRRHKTTYLCNYCSKPVKNMTRYNIHVQTHFQRTKTCTLCDFGSTSKKILNEHYRSVHTGIKCYKCEICDKQFSCASSLGTHVKRIHEKAPKYPCSYCDKQFFERNKVKVHIDTVHKKLIRYSCDVCGAGFVYKVYWVQHMLRFHGVKVTKIHEKNAMTTEGKKPNLKKSSGSKKVTYKGPRSRLFCPKCNISFKTSMETRIHKGNHFYTCPVCKKNVKGSQYYQHLRTHKPKTLACDQCDYRTHFPCFLKSHKLTHSGAGRDHLCHLCTKAYTSISNLRSHIRRDHENEKRYICDMCDKRFYYKAGLEGHINSHMGVKKYQCSVCGQLLSRRSHWTKHMRRSHGIVIPPAPKHGRGGNQIIEMMA